MAAGPSHEIIKHKTMQQVSGGWVYVLILNLKSSGSQFASLSESSSAHSAHPPRSASGARAPHATDILAASGRVADRAVHCHSARASQARSPGWQTRFRKGETPPLSPTADLIGCRGKPSHIIYLASYFVATHPPSSNTGRISYRAKKFRQHNRQSDHHRSRQITSFKTYIALLNRMQEHHKDRTLSSTVVS